MAVEYTRRRKGFTFDTHDNYAWFWDRLVILKLLYLSWKKKIEGSWKNSRTFYRYSSCFLWGVSDGPQFGWMGRAFYGKLWSAAKTYSLYKLPVICLCVFNPRITTVFRSQKVTLVAVIGGFRSDLSITRMTDGNFGNVSAGVLFSKVAYQRKRW